LDIKCSVEKAIGDPFWLTQELAFSDDLISKTSAWFMNTSIDSADTNKLRKQGSLLQPLQPVSQDLAKAIVFTCERDQLAGVLHQSSEKSSLAVVIVVGGPQYRVGSHRQFTFLARYLAAQGIPVLRFDYRGMGDSSGELEGFEHINSDISSAVDALQREQPWVEKIAIWGLCDGATASVFYAATDSRVRVLILVNPWVYSSQGAAKAYLKHYYSQRLFQRTFWCKVFSGDFRIFDSIQSAWGMLKGVFAKTTPAKEGAIPVEKKAVNADQPRDDLVTRFGGRLEEFLGDVVFVLSGKDLTAAEFLDASRSNRKLRRMMKRDKVSQVSLPNSDHTFSNSVARKEVEELTLEILRLY
jgi:exosortase A-associated hydrolase 1